MKTGVRQYHLKRLDKKLCDKYYVFSTPLASEKVPPLKHLTSKRKCSTYLSESCLKTVSNHVA
jgi:hypothetical protein